MSNINILLTRNLWIDSGVRQWRHALMIPLHCLWAKSNNRTCGKFECNVTWFCFYFEFIRSHARCGCRSIVYYRGWVGGVGGFVWNWTSKIKGVEQFWTLIDKGGWGSWKLDNFLGCHMGIVPSKAGFLKVVSFSGGGRGQFDPSSYFKKNQSNISITLYNC